VSWVGAYCWTWRSCTASLDHDVAAVGPDNSAIEAIPFDGGGFMAAPRALLVGGGIPFPEHLRLEELAADGRTEFLFVAAPLLITGGSGSPAEPAAGRVSDPRPPRGGPGQVDRMVTAAVPGAP